ncbi:flavoprotein [Amycolatopsis nigrescens]|uniref:flavoprotein n=1 Tax=Amycolatopsis nigrescens TaxID=381445 RepID=UPI00036E6E13|nr:flavoprotein [Amycolatopsis nigrescens]
MTERVLYLMVTGAGPAKRVDVMIELAQDAGWSVYCIASPAAVTHFLDLAAIERLTGHPARTGYRKPGDPSLPVPDAVIVAPATYNTINKFAAGIADTYLTTQLAELSGIGVPVVVLPFVNQSLASNRPFQRSVEELRRDGVRVLLGEGAFEPHPPRGGDKVLDHYPWKLALDSATEMAAPR